MSIFVSLAAFCEPLLEFTLDGLYGKAAKPAKVMVGLVDQTFDNNREWLAKKSYWPQVRYVQINPIDTRGVSWARSIVFSLYQGEDYLLQIDSHTHFDQNWDERLIGSLEHLKNLAKKPILSTYPPPFEFDDDDQPFKPLKPAGTIYALRKHPETELTATCATLRFRVEHVRGGDYLEGFHIGAGFLFTLGQFVEEVPYDPYMYFHGEEQNLTIRAYTRGWSIYHPKHELIPVFHLYKQKDNSHRTHHWHPDYEKARTIKWTTLKEFADSRLVQLIYMQKHDSPYGLGTQRSLEEFAQFSGINYLSTSRIQEAKTVSTVPPLPS